MANDGILCPKCLKVEMKPRPAAAGAGTMAYQCPSSGKMAVLETEAERITRVKFGGAAGGGVKAEPVTNLAGPARVPARKPL
jgi:hypothetical protein